MPLIKGSRRYTLRALGIDHSFINETPVANPITRHGNTIHIKGRVPLLVRLFALPFIFLGGYCLCPVILSVRDVATGLAQVRDVIAAQFVFLFLGLAFGLPTLALLLMRRFVDIDMDQGIVSSVRQFAVLKFTSTCPLASITYVRNTWEQEDNVSIYNVEFIGAPGTDAILARVCRTRQESEAIARGLAATLKLPYKDETQEEPEANC